MVYLFLKLEQAYQFHLYQHSKIAKNMVSELLKLKFSKGNTLQAFTL